MTDPSPRSCRALQIVIGVLAAVPIITGLMDVILGTATLPTRPESNPDLESNYRFFAMIWLGAGLTLAWIVPRVRTAVLPLRAVAGIVFAGGFARVLSLLVSGVPSPLFVFFAVLELVAPPVLILWQNRVRVDV
ncbi:DUF4345 domain-containing protein [Actinoplanes sp. NPDC051851]|uniref:DUF4345 domain-containing protein n=1 Tax=Actinoplanes sp. NPDC051851 TaxID=3154753 RepID=UPI003430A73E